MFSQRKWGYLRILLLALAIFSQINVAMTFGNINEDETYSMGEAISFIQGKGLTVSPIKAADLGNIQYLHTLKFPIGVSLLYASFLKLGFTSGVTDFALDVIAIILFFTFWFIILEQLSEYIPQWIKIILWLFWAIFPAPLMAGAMTGHTADLLAIALFSGNIAFLLLGVKNPPKLLVYSILSGIFMGLAATLKFVFWPILAVGPLSLAIMSLIACDERQKYFFAGVITAATSGLFLAGMMVESWLTSGHIYGYTFTLTGKLVPRLLPSPEILWNQIFMATPIPAYSLGMTPYSFYAVRNLKLIPLTLVGDRYAWIYSIFILVVFFATSIWILISLRRRTEPNQGLVFFTIAGIVTTVWIFGWQIWLSVAYRAMDYVGGWVPLMDIRYNSPVFPFLILGILMAILQVSKIQISWLKYGLTLALVVSLIYPTYIAIRSKVSIIEKQISFGMRLRADETFASRTEDLKRMIAGVGKSNQPVVVLFPDSDKDYVKIRQSVFLSGVPGLILPGEHIPTSRPINVILLYQQDLSPEKQAYYEQIASSYAAKCDREMNDFVYCSFTVKP